ncbi:uncharacterized protein LOC123979414 [Micropterus dolomieu]|uniref:uncharacterized protein LOC123979414 n=1 Tax=Micropterus dolomieu TaxID=147949 RepID=UPI001E8D886D|nr:uncharacterized protein LOC123979414 [Micropterus dolomieu]
MLDTEGQWSEALASNNIRAIIRWLRKLTAEGFSRCQGLWMFLDRSSFTRVHMLLQRLRNLLTLAQWARKQLSSAHLWHGVGVPCVVCRDAFGSSNVRRGCWTREHRVLKQHIWLGRLVQWWGIMGLLPKYPEAHEVKRISQMWKEMDHSHRKARLETPGWEEGERFRSLIQGMVSQLDRQHGCIWTSEDCTDQCYPPPNLQALLKLVLVPHIDNMSVQAIFMYFVLDMANFLQCKDDLLQSFCHAFTIPSSFSQQIRAFWMFDLGHIKASMELLLSPRAAVPWLTWQHSCIIHCLLMKKQPQLAFRYLHWTRPAIESEEVSKLCADVLIQNSCVSEAWALLKRGHTESDNLAIYFLQACNGFGLCAEPLKYITAGHNGQGHNANANLIEATDSQLLLLKKAGSPPCPLSAKLYQAKNVNRVSPEELVQLVRNAVMEVRKPRPKTSEVVWPEHTERKSNSREMFLSTQALRHLTPSPSPMDMVEESEQTAHTDEREEEQPIHNQPEPSEQISSSEDLSSGSVSSFTSASSLPLLRLDCAYVYKSTLTLQRMSSLLNERENHSWEEEDEEDRRTPSSTEAFPDCAELTVTLDGTTTPIFLSNLNKDALVELVLSAEEGEEGEKTDVFSSRDFLSVDAVESSEDNQSVPNLCEPQMESHSFHSPDDEKMACCKEVSEKNVHGPPDVTDMWSSAVSLNQEDQSDCIPYKIFSFSEAPNYFLEEEPHQKTTEHQQQEEAVERFSQSFSCAMSETTRELLTDLHKSFLSEDPVASGSRASAVMGPPEICLPSPVSSSTYPTQLQISGSPLTPSLTCNIKTTSAPSDTTNESFPKAHLKVDEPCVQSTSAWLDHSKMGSWWKQDLEACRAIGSLLPATEPGAAITSDNKRPSLVLSQTYSYSLVNFMDFTAKQKGDDKQADREEPAGWSSLGKVFRGAIRSGRTRSRKGKRVMRA